MTQHDGDSLTEAERAGRAWQADRTEILAQLSAAHAQLREAEVALRSAMTSRDDAVQQAADLQTRWEATAVQLRHLRLAFKNAGRERDELTVRLILVEQQLAGSPRPGATVPRAELIEAEGVADELRARLRQRRGTAQRLRARNAKLRDEAQRARVEADEARAALAAAGLPGPARGPAAEVAAGRALAVSEPGAPLTVAFVSAPGSSVFMEELLGGVCDAVALAAPDVTVVSHHGLVSDVVDRSTVAVVVPHEYLAVAPHEPDEVLTRTIAFGVEHPGTATFRASMRASARFGARFEISQRSLDALAKHGLDGALFPLGHVPRWDLWGGRPVERDVDVAYLGTADPRRLGILAHSAPALAGMRTELLTPPHEPMTGPRPDFLCGEDKWRLLARSKVLVNLHREDKAALEWVRVLEAMHNGCLVVTEPSTDLGPLRPGSTCSSRSPTTSGSLRPRRRVTTSCASGSPGRRTTCAGSSTWPVPQRSWPKSAAGSRTCRHRRDPSPSSTAGPAGPTASRPWPPGSRGAQRSPSTRGHGSSTRPQPVLAPHRRDLRSPGRRARRRRARDGLGALARYPRPRHAGPRRHSRAGGGAEAWPATPCSSRPTRRTSRSSTAGDELIGDTLEEMVAAAARRRRARRRPVPRHPRHPDRWSTPWSPRSAGSGSATTSPVATSSGAPPWRHWAASPRTRTTPTSSTTTSGSPLPRAAAAPGWSAGSGSPCGRTDLPAGLEAGLPAGLPAGATRRHRRGGLPLDRPHGLERPRRRRPGRLLGRGDGAERPGAAHDRPYGARLRGGRDRHHDRPGDCSLAIRTNGNTCDEIGFVMDPALPAAPPAAAAHGRQGLRSPTARMISGDPTVSCNRMRTRLV